MEATEKDKIRQSVRESYSKIARGEHDATIIAQATSCCSETKEINGSGEIGLSGCDCGVTAFTTEKISELMGYSKEDIAEVPAGANLGLGCGNPLALASLKPGETLVDLGSGGGFDCFLAARYVGDSGRVIGVDMTPDMVSKARLNAEKTQLKNVEFRLGEIENLPIGDNMADIIISNCVINLSPDKQRVFQEAFRVLKPGGRLSISDIVATAKLPDEIQKNLALLSACIAGAATIDDTRAMLDRAGFDDIRITPKDESRPIISEWVPGRNAGDYVVSASIEAIKQGTNLK